MEAAWTHTEMIVSTAKQAQDCILQGHLKRWHTKRINKLDIDTRTTGFKPSWKKREMAAQDRVDIHK